MITYQSSNSVNTFFQKCINETRKRRRRQPWNISNWKSPTIDWWVIHATNAQLKASSAPGEKKILDMDGMRRHLEAVIGQSNDGQIGFQAYNRQLHQKKKKTTTAILNQKQIHSFIRWALLGIFDQTHGIHLMLSRYTSLIHSFQFVILFWPDLLTIWMGGWFTKPGLFFTGIYSKMAHTLLRRFALSLSLCSPVAEIV